MAVIRQRIEFVGRVQGVGFRYTCASLANHYGLIGWVRNEYDGSVVAELQGQLAQIDAVIADLQRGHFIRVDYVYRNNIGVEPNETGFRITG